MRRTLFGGGRIAIGVMVGAGLLWAATRGVDWQLVAENLAGVSMGLLALSVVVFMFASYLRAVRWRDPVYGPADLHHTAVHNPERGDWPQQPAARQNRQ